MILCTRRPFQGVRSTHMHTLTTFGLETVMESKKVHSWARLIGCPKRQTENSIANLFYYSVSHSFSAVTYQSVGTRVHSTLHFVISWKSLVAFANHCPFTVVYLSGPQCSEGGLIENIQQDILPPVGYNRLVYFLWCTFQLYLLIPPISSPVFCRNK